MTKSSTPAKSSKKPVKVVAKKAVKEAKKSAPVKKKKEETRLVTISVEAVDQNGEVKAGGDLIIKC